MEYIHLCSSALGMGGWVNAQQQHAIIHTCYLCRQWGNYKVADDVNLKPLATRPT